MRKLFLIALLITSFNSFAQSDSTKWLRAFPITDYIVDLNDTIKLVQLEMPEGIVLKEKQLALLRGTYGAVKSDTAEKGYGRCNLIKGQFYYFTIGNNKSGAAIKAGDLLYTFMDKSNIFFGQIPKLASHFIQLQTVYEEPMYDRYLIFNGWTAEKEKALIDSMVVDIKFTGNYFLENDASMDKLATSGTFKGQKTLSVMANCKAQYVKDFLDYVIARPRLYAGSKWKISEVFATWVAEGAPMVVRE